MTIPLGPGTTDAAPGGNPQAGGPSAIQAANRLLNTFISASTSALSGGVADPQLDALSPPPQLKTLVYSPNVRVIIAHSGVHGNVAGKQYDVSNDIVRASLHRAESSAATFFMTLANKDLRYTPRSGQPLFSRMDRIVVYMKRSQEYQVFSGYLDMVPWRQLYPGTVDFKATCTIKRLMHTWWNPALPMAGALLEQMAQIGLQGDGQLGSSDSGLGSMLRRILTEVGGWNMIDIHIQNFPQAFYTFLKAQIAKTSPQNAKAVYAFDQMLLGDDHTQGPGGTAGHNANAGPPGPSIGLAGAGGTGTPLYIQAIIQACDDRGLGPLVSDNTYTSSTQQAGATGANSNDHAAQKAFQQIQQANQSAQQANRDSDAAIIGVAVAAVETGQGVTIHNYSNPAVPGSAQWGEGPPPYPADGDSCGIFQQRALKEWGDVSQRMNPQQAAGMFFNAMTTLVPNWRNIPPAKVAQLVQRGVDSNEVAYNTAISTFAKAAVQAARTATGAGSTAGGTSGAGAITAPLGTGSAPSINSGLVAGAPGITAAAAGAGGADPTASMRPHPDSEGAINFALSKVMAKIPYVWGGKGPLSYDCSGLVSAAFGSINVAVPSQTLSIRNSIPQIPRASAGRGDIYEPESGHVTILLTPPGPGGLLVQASDPSSGLNVHPWYSEGDEWYGRACLNGGPDPASPYNPVAMAVAGGSGTAPGALDQQGYGTTAGSSGSDQLIARNLFSYMFSAGRFADQLAGMMHAEKVFIDGSPLIQIVSSICKASLREFQSGPDGTFMAYYPDWWGLDGKPCVFRLEDIELKDASLSISDDPLTTHCYVEGDQSMVGAPGTEERGWLDTAGVATVENDWLYSRLIQVAPGAPEFASGQEVLRRYGVRPLQQQSAMAGSHELELILACQLFMQKWAQQYQTTIELTFMPELMPGMRVELAGHNLSVYVTEVTHQCDYENGFSTSAVIMAPANPNALQQMAGVTTAPSASDALQGFITPIFGVVDEVMQTALGSL